MILSSPAFRNSSPLPSRFAHRGVTGGANTSPPLRWSDAPADTGSFALSCVDLHPIARQWVHWIVVNIPESATEFPEGISRQSLPAEALELDNSFGEPGYGGPQPPRGSGIHRYVFTLYALSASRIELSPHASLPLFLKTIAPVTVAKAELTGTYER